MRIGCLQFAPRLGEVDQNITRADQVLAEADVEDLDLLVLPELAFSGYNFKSLKDIASSLEESRSGVSALWAQTIALKHNCVVVVGYPEKVDPAEKWPTDPEYFNSALIVNGDGDVVGNYRKSFLYYTDETWALEGGRGFFEGYIPCLGYTSLGICMDINPYKFEAPWNAYEFAFHALEYRSNLVIVSMAWITREDQQTFLQAPEKPDLETLTYWVSRMDPLLRRHGRSEVIVVFCNRSGVENEATYAGTTAVIGIQDGVIRVYGLLGRSDERVLVVDTENPPFARMEYRSPTRPQEDEAVSSFSPIEERGRKP